MFYNATSWQCKVFDSQLSETLEETKFFDNAQQTLTLHDMLRDMAAGENLLLMGNQGVGSMADVVFERVEDLQKSLMSYELMRQEGRETKTNRDLRNKEMKGRRQEDPSQESFVRLFMLRKRPASSFL